jgi:hypothetical protein
MKKKKKKKTLEIVIKHLPNKVCCSQITIKSFLVILQNTLKTKFENPKLHYVTKHAPYAPYPQRITSSASGVLNVSL